MNEASAWILVAIVGGLIFGWTTMALISDHRERRSDQHGGQDD